MGIEYLNEAIMIVLNNMKSLPDKAIDELYFQCYAEVMERNLGAYVEYEEVDNKKEEGA